MYSDLSKRVKKAGQLPGTLIYTGNKLDVEPLLTILTFSHNEFNEKIGRNFAPEETTTPKDMVTWIHLEGLQDINLVNSLADYYQLHPLTVEDILNVSQRSKIEDFTNYIFITMKVLLWNSALNETIVEQLSIVIGSNFVLSFVESKCSIFSAIKERLRSRHKQNILECSSDYLAYRLMDSTIDQYFVVIEKLSDKIEVLEESIIQKPIAKNASELYHLKHKLLLIRKAVWPIREEVSHLLQADHQFISSGTRLYLRDVYDHVVQAIEIIENLRDMLASILDIYLSLVTNRLNEVMKVLTIISTFFIPLTFITSMYGMNFKWMPELEWRWGYPCVITLMLAISCGMLLFFRRKKWI